MVEPALRRLQLGDAPAVLEAFAADPMMARQGAVTCVESARAYIARLVDPAGPHEAWAIEARLPDADEPSCVGLVLLTVDGDNRLGWFSYWAHPAVRGRGLVGRAARSVADWALGPDGPCERLELGHRANNPASGGVARSAGFVHEGTERAKFVVDGERVDVLTYGRLASDPWPDPALPRLAMLQ